MKPINKVFIIGSGFIGNALYTECIRRPVHAKIISRKQIDYFSFDKVVAFFGKEFGCERNIVVNCSGFTGRPNIDQCEIEKEKTWKFNVILPKILEEATHTAGGTYCQISSGCIYNGYDKPFTETDKPNFGLFDADSSFYSKSKHAAELSLNASESYIWRIRMPFTYSDVSNPRNYLSKLLSYENLISNVNSRTCVEDFVRMLGTFCVYPDSLPAGIYNAVNPNPLTVSEVVAVLPDKYKNPNWKWIPLHEMQTAAGRSNCVLSDNKLRDYDYQLPSEIESWKKLL